MNVFHALVYSHIVCFVLSGCGGEQQLQFCMHLEKVADVLREPLRDGRHTAVISERAITTEVGDGYNLGTDEAPGSS